MAHADWRRILEALESLPSGLPTEHVALMACWFQRRFGESAVIGSQLPAEASETVTAGLEGLSFVAVRRRMERLRERKELRLPEKALLCAWVWSLGGTKDFCSNDAQKLFGEDGGSLNAHHFNQQAKPSGEEGARSAGSSLVRVGRGRYRFTPRGREEGERLARQFLFPPEDG